MSRKGSGPGFLATWPVAEIVRFPPHVNPLAHSLAFECHPWRLSGQTPVTSQGEYTESIAETCGNLTFSATKQDHAKEAGHTLARELSSCLGDNQGASGLEYMTSVSLNAWTVL